MINKSIINMPPMPSCIDIISPTEIDTLVTKLIEQEHTVKTSIAVVESMIIEKIFDEWHTRDESNYQKALKHQLNQIQSALQRYHQGKYGLCVVCGKQIAKQLLINDPTTAQCKSC